MFRKIEKLNFLFGPLKIRPPIRRISAVCFNKKMALVCPHGFIPHCPFGCYYYQVIPPQFFLQFTPPPPKALPPAVTPPPTSLPPAATTIMPLKKIPDVTWEKVVIDGSNFIHTNYKKITGGREKHLKSSDILKFIRKFIMMHFLKSGRAYNFEFVINEGWEKLTDGIIDIKKQLDSDWTNKRLLEPNYAPHLLEISVVVPTKTDHRGASEFDDLVSIVHFLESRTKGKTSLVSSDKFDFNNKIKSMDKTKISCVTNFIGGDGRHVRFEEELIFLKEHREELNKVEGKVSVWEYISWLEGK